MAIRLPSLPLNTGEMNQLYEILAQVLGDDGFNIAPYGQDTFQTE